jgi:hypothetical protein
MVKLNFEKAAKYTNLKPGMVNHILACNSVLRINFPIERVRQISHSLLSVLRPSPSLLSFYEQAHTAVSTNEFATNVSIARTLAHSLI